MSTHGLTSVEQQAIEIIGIRMRSSTSESSEGGRYARSRFWLAKEFRARRWKWIRTLKIDSTN